MMKNILLVCSITETTVTAGAWILGAAKLVIWLSNTKPTWSARGALFDNLST